ncbi:MAG TPA: iron-sulfur cluster insertion protein ErpA [Aggregatilineales bacterium]|nr:iron-sulfur cluster insertion protein ErpA [Aggregatilineales bacterium]
MAINELEMISPAVETQPLLTVTPAAVQIIQNLLQQRNIPNHALRVFVSGGGCSGMQYGMAFEEAARDHDRVVSIDGVKLVVDPTSLIYLQGAVIDYVDSLMGGGFRIDNPNAVSSCGCGHSFRTANDSGTESSGGCSSCSH